MTLLSRLIGSRAISFQDVWGKGADFDIGLATAAGIPVSQETALRLVAVFSCVRLLSESVASLPVAAFRRDKDARRPLEQQPRWLDEPNPETLIFELVEATLTSLNLDGNAYWLVIRDRFDEVVEVWVLDPAVVTPRRAPDRSIVFDVAQDDGLQKTYRSEREARIGIKHIRAFRRAGAIKGMSPIEKARQAIGLGLATEEFGSRYFQQGTLAGTVIEFPSDAKETAIDRFLERWKNRHQGVKRAHSPGVLTGGASMKQIGIPPEHAQFLETRKFQVVEIARLFRVPPHMIADLDRATFSNIEHEAIQFVVHSLRPWLVRLEQATRSLLPPGVFLRFNVNGLLRGDIKSRYDAYGVGRQWGWLSADDVLELEDEEPLPDGKGKVYLQPVNMQPAGDRPAPAAS